MSYTNWKFRTCSAGRDSPSFYGARRLVTVFGEARIWT